MSDTVIKVENISKEYRLGVISHGTLYRDLQSWSAKMLGRDDPNAKIASSTRQHQNKSFKALDDINFDVKRGEVLGIIGRNGAGKSTLLKIISRVTAPSSGVIKIKGRVASLLEIGTGFHPELTGRENVYLNGAIMGMDKAEISRKFNEIVDFSGVEQFIDTPVKRYSSGMYVRLAFAVAAHLEPEILVIDEVLAVGDAEFQKKCLGKMDDVAKEGRTVLFVSHNMAAIRNLCSRSILIEHGALEKTGSPDQVIFQYLKKNLSASNNGYVDLANIIRSSGTQKGAIKRAWIEDETNNIISSFPMGAKIKICFYFESNIKPEYGVGVSDNYGNQIFAGGSVSVKKEGSPSTPVQRGTVVFEYDVFPVAPGIYNTSFGLNDMGNTVDLIENAMQFEVSENDYFGNGKTYVGRYGMVFVENKLYLRDAGV